jgi:hypothetical protein
MMVSLPSDGMQQIAEQLGTLNVFIGVYLICKGVGFVTAVVMRRDPPRKSIRPEVARSDGS